ncbi:MAG TPA: hypothetical protein VFK42_12140 [Acidimicrobiales bacterium]|jgi:hypothetical protein|nr:hypothetical protein [Acidimicrobiales bacterium]
MAPSTVSFAQFSSLARRVADQARGLGLVPPAFRTPPRVAGVDRTLRRQRDGRVGGVVAVRLAGRPPAAVVGDLVDGVIAVNGLGGDEAVRARSALLAGIPAGVLGRAA